MCAHIGQNRDIYRRVLSAYISDSYTPSPFCAGWRWGLLSRKIFSDFIFLFLLFDFYSYFIFSESFNSIQVPRYFSWVSFFWFIQYNKLSFWLVTSFTQYLLVCDSRIRLWILTRINFDLFQHCRLYALTLQLFISSACYKQTSMLMQSLVYAYFWLF